MIRLRGHFDGTRIVLDEPIPDNLGAHTPVEISIPEQRELLDEASGPTKQPSSQRDVPWSAEKDARRCELIDRKIQGILQPAESREFAELQKQALEYFDRVAPPPVEGARRLHESLVKKMREQQD